MATAKRTTATLRNSRRRQTLPILPNSLTAAGIASANCRPRADLVRSTHHLTLFYLDTINITYNSCTTHPALSCWCGTSERATQKLDANNVSPRKGSALIHLNFFSDDPCWFELTSRTRDCVGVSEHFFLSPKRRAVDDGVAAPNSTLTPTLTLHQLESSSTASPLTARSAAAVDSREAAAGGDSFSVGAKAALGIGIALICIAIGAMASFLYFRRRRHGPDDEVSGCIFNHGRRGGRKGPEKKRVGAASDTSGQSDEPLCPVQPVFDGFPGSMGYEDVRSLHSTTHSHSLHSHSPTAVQSPAHSHSGAFWTQERSIEREELETARLKSQLNATTPTIVSYGPNPATPIVKPRALPRLDAPSVITPISPNTLEPLPDNVPMFADYTSYNLTPSSNPAPSPPRQPAIPIVVSYGPNKVTPTPLVVSPTVPPDESMVNRRFQELQQHPHPHPHQHERQFSWEADSPLLGVSNMGPLPPYASSEDFEAMEKGAVRKLAEPQAEAELPPTKDGFYHYTSDVVEYELPGAAPQRGPQLPFRPYEQRAAAAAKAQAQVISGGSGGSGLGVAGRRGGGGGGGMLVGRGGRDIDEQKVLLDDEDMKWMKAEKARIRAAAAGAEGEASAAKERRVEEYDLGEGLAGQGR
ncbi:hypothetical protein N657DRAFT_620066 [Parathielavia appendiculata]|uniref:Uncharacterized protein n=1 Tax=Parathielavia appendiculata TaxID=2587402 RepID=A0AAN6TZT0_9PEZI|nr:hypothetical protein N657DRAFT_620066 [Parathielavia appendiculata]